ncbi:MAG: tetratricopeptide repeat protein [bacterium]|nr:tetratricopeptide repeat protein [bacterium]
MGQDETARNAPIFLSYSSTDREFCLRLQMDLEAAGLDTWVDKKGIAPGREWQRQIQEALSCAGAVLLVLSPGAVDSSTVQAEVSFARDEGKLVVPVICRPCEIPWHLRPLQHVDLSTEAKYRDGLAELVDHLRRRPTWRPVAGGSIPPRHEWQLEEKLDEGPHGEVWAARRRDGEERRFVKLGFDDEQLAALRREVEVFREAKLEDRTGVCQILDWSLTVEPYRVESEYAPRLVDWAGDRNTLADLPLTDRLEIVACVADALDELHRADAPHGNVEPGNVLVRSANGDQPRVKLWNCGWGPGASDLYRDRRLAADAPASREADLYALGVVLYQMTVGDLARPLGPGWERDIDDQLLRADVAAMIGTRPKKRIRRAAELAQRLRSLPIRKSQRRTRGLVRWLSAAVAVSLLLAVAIWFHSVRVSREAETAEQVSRFLLELFEAANPWERKDGAIPAREVLDRGAERIRDELGDRPVVQARLMDAIGTVYGQLALHDQAESLLAGAVAIREGRPESEILDLAASLHRLARVYVGQGRYQDAKPLFDRALSIRQDILGSDHPDVASSLIGLGNLHLRRSDFAAAEEHYLRAGEIREKAFRNQPEDEDRIRHLAQSDNNLANLYEIQERYDEAESCYLRARARQIETLGENHPSVAVTDNNLANLHKARGRFTEARKTYAAALKSLEKAFGEDHPAVAMILNNLGNLHYERGRYEEAEKHHLRALEVREKYFGDQHPDVAMSHGNLANLYDDRGKTEKARSYYAKACEGFESSLGPDHTEVALCCKNLARLYSEQGRHEAAAGLLHRALAIYEETFGEDHTEVAFTLAELAFVEIAREDYDRAAEYFERELEILDRVLGEDHVEVARELNNLAETYKLQQRHEEAEPLFVRALAILEAAPEQRDLRGQVRDGYVELLRRLGRSGEAISLETGPAADG